MNDRLMDVSKAHRLDDPERLLWLPPAAVLAALAVQHGDAVADLGAGTGYFSLPLARAVGAGGLVYAIDCQAEMLAHLQAKLDSAKIANVQPILAEAASTGLPDASCNLVFLALVWHEIADRADLLREANRLLKPGGKLAILDWRPDADPEHGPPLDHRISASDAAESVHSAGFLAVAQCPIGKYTWLVRASSSGESQR
jgi:ubiquinone/menaquinone biosynthesis C-methylase UbiE